jgi:hypothetical protein
MGLLDQIGSSARQITRWIGESEEDVPFDEMKKALTEGGLAEPTDEKPRALFHDPYSVMDWGGWRQRPSAITYETLRQMSVQNTVIAAIVNLRINQVSQFARPQQQSYDKGYRIVLRDRRDTQKQMTPGQIKMAQELEAMLETTGYMLPDERYSDRDSFRTHTRKAVRDILTYDQWCYEKIRDKRGLVSRFICLPGETIRPAVVDREHLDPEALRDRVSHVQVYDNSIIAEFGVDDIAWNVMNPRSDLRANGFGFAPIEQIIRLVTAWLFGFEYNTRFFTQGSAIKGLLNIKGAIPDRQLRAFRRMWYGQISGVQNSWKTPILNAEEIQWLSMHANNREMEYGSWMDWLCLCGESKINTSLGDVPVSDLIDRQFRVWDGTGWHEARAVATGERDVAVTRLSNGAELRTSPQHFFRVLVGGRGEWIAQKDLKTDDVVVLDTDGKALPNEYEYPQARVVEAWATGEREDMFDIEVFNDRHLFFANGIAVHNTKLTAAVYGVDPIEINFIFGGSGSSGSGAMFDKRPNQAEVVESKDKGLRPLCDFMVDSINQHLIWEQAPELEFAFTGLDAKEEGKERERRNIEVKAWKTVDEIRAEMDLDPLPDGQGEVILDPTWLQYMQAKSAMDEGLESSSFSDPDAEQGDPNSGGDNPFAAGGDDDDDGGDDGGGDDGDNEPREQDADKAEDLKDSQQHVRLTARRVESTAMDLQKAMRSRILDGDKQVLEIDTGSN